MSADHVAHQQVGTTAQRPPVAGVGRLVAEQLLGVAATEQARMHLAHQPPAVEEVVGVVWARLRAEGLQGSHHVPCG